MRLAGHVACKGDMRNTYINLIRKHQGVRCRGWDDNIKADLKRKDVRVWTGLIFLRIGESGRISWTR